MTLKEEFEKATNTYDKPTYIGDPLDETVDYAYKRINWLESCLLTEREKNRQLEQYFRDRAEKYRTVYNNCWGWRGIAEEYDKAADKLK